MNEKTNENMNDEIGYVQYFENDLMGVKTEDGKIIVPAEYSFIAPVSDDSFQVIKGKKHGFVDLNGNEFIELTDEVECYSDFSEGLAAFRKDKKWGFIDKTGKVVIEAKFQYCECFHDGLCKISNEDGRFGFINKSGDTVIDCQFKYVTDFSNGHAIFQDDKTKLLGLINKEGNIVIEPEYVYLSEVVNGKSTIQIQKGDDINEGILDINTKEIEWNNNLEHLNEFNRYSKKLSSEFKNLISDYNKASCPCVHPRFRNYVEWKNEDRFFDGELLFGAAREFFEKINELQDPAGEFAGIWEYKCPKCGTEYRETWRDFGDGFEVTNVEIFNYKSEDAGEPCDNSRKTPVVLGFAGYDDIIGKYQDAHEYVEIKDLIDYLKE